MNTYYIYIEDADGEPVKIATVNCTESEAWQIARILKGTASTFDIES